MLLSHFKKKNNDINLNQAKLTPQPFKNVGARVKVLGSGCVKCNQLEAAAREALEELGMNAAIDHVTDFAEIAAYGVMSTPALVVDDKVVSYGRVLKKDEVVAILRKVSII